ncbi:hypothetical protein JQM64_08820 [Fournierella massiliensis]|nr:hypothetical protein [Fournierella massiliensis]MCF2557614.1 hypothetical protein [Fournierella massiliensis]
MAVKYDGISESGLNSLNDQEVVSRAKQKLKSDLEAGMVSIDQAMELVNNMKTIEQMSPESNVPQYSMSTLSKIKAAYDKPYIEAQKAAEKAAKAAQSSSKSSKSKDEEEAEAEALYQKMMGGENAQSSTNANSAADSTKTDKPAEKEEPEKEKGFLAKAADWLKNAFSKAEQKAFTEDSENSQKTVLSAHPQQHGQGFANIVANSQKQVLSAHPQQQGQGFANIVANAAKQAPTVIKNAVREQGVKATRQQALDAGYSERQADLKAEAFRKMLEENDKEKELKKQTDAVLSQRWEADYGAMLDDLSQTDRDIIKQLSQIEYELDNGTTGGYQHVQYLKKMSDSYRDTLEQHGISGLDLDELVRYQQAQTDNQNTAQAKQERQDYVNEGAGNAALASGRSILEGTVGNIGGYADILAQKADRLITGSKAPVNTNSQAQLASNLADTTRQQVSGNIADTVYQETGNEFLAQLAANGYQLGMSGADSLAALPLSFVSGGGATVALGLGAANQGFKQAKAQGATDNQALAYGTLAGAAEGLFEKFSLDNIKAMARTDKKGLSNFFLNTLKSMGVEGSEEALTQISNDFSEMLVLGDNSTLQQVYNDEYARAIAEGLSEAEARERAQTAQATALWQDVGAAALGGAAMGGVMGGGAQLIGKAARGVKNRFSGQGATPSPEMQTGTESVLPSLNDQTVQETENPSRTGALGQDAGQALPALGNPAPMNDSSGNQEVTFILQKMASGQTLSGKEVETLIQGENREAVETALGTTLPETKSAARRFVRDLEAKAQAGVADNNEHVEANLPGLQEPLDQQEIPGYTETEMSTGGAENGDYREAAGDRQVPFDTEIYRADQPGDPYVRTGNEPGRSAESDGSITGGQYDSTGDDGIPSDIEPGTAGDSVAYSYARNQSGGNEGVRRVLTGSAEIGKAIQEYGATPIELRDTTSDPQLFSSALEAARQANPHGLMVSGKTVEELTQPGTLTFMSPDNTAGALVTVDGDIEAVFKHPKSNAKGASTSLLLTAIQNGGRKLDCYGADLVSIYNKHGFEAVARIPWNPEYAPEGWTYGPKDVYVMKLRDGETADSIASGLNLKEAEGGFHRQTQEELDALPEFDDYDSALAYRDSLIQNTGNAEQRLPGLGDDLTGTATNPSVGAADHGFGGEVKKSKVASNTMTNTGLIEDEERAKLGLDEEGSYVYQVAKNDDSVKAAAERLNADFEGAVNDLNQKQDEWTAQDTDTAMLAVSKLLHDGKTAEAQRLLRNLQGHSTEAGQAIQALAKYTHTGEYAIAKGLKILESNGQQWKKENRRESAKLDDIAQNLMDFASKEDTSESGNMDDEFSEFVRRGGMEPLQTAAKRIEQKGLTLEQMEAELRKLIEKSSLKDSTKKRLKDDVVKEIAKRALNGATVRELSSLFDNYLANGLFEFDDATVSQIMELYEKAGNERNGSREQAKYQDEAVSLIASKIGKTSFADKLNMYRYWSMLSSPKTLIKNEFGNIAMGHITQTKAAVKSVLEKVYSHFDKDYTRTTTLLNYASKADQDLLKATAADADAVSYQNLTSGASRFKPESVQRSTQFFARADNETGVKGAVKRGVNKVISYPGNTLERTDYSGLSGINALKKLGISEDRFLASPLAQAGLRNQYKFALARYLKANKIDSSVFSLEQRVEANPDMKLTAQEKSSLEALRKGREYAVREAKQATFHDQNAISKLLNDLVKSGKNHSGKGQIDYSDEVSLEEGANALGLIADALVPFRSTTSNIVARGVEYSPLGFAKAVLDGTVFKRGPEKVLDELAKAMTGSGLAVLGYILAKAGWVNSSGDDDSDKNKFDEMQGKQNYSINLPGGGSYEIGFTAPASIPFFIGAEMAEGDLNSSAAYSLIANSLNPLFDNTLLSSISDVLNTGKYSENDAEVVGSLATQAVANYSNQLIPSIGKQVGRAMQESRRSSYTESTGTQGTLDYNAQRMVNWLPGLGEPYIDAWGREQENVGGNFAGKLAYNVLSPGYYSPGNSTEVDKELEALYEATGDSGVLPSLADKTYGSDKTRFTEEEYTDYAKIRGQTAYDLIEELTGSDGFSRLEEEDKAELVKYMFDLAGAVGKEEVVGLQPTSSSIKKLYEAYQERGASGAASYALATSQIVPTGKESETTGEKGTTKGDLYRAYFGTSESVQNQAQNYLTKANDQKADEVYQKFGAAAVKEWVQYKTTVDLDKNGGITQTEAEVWLNHSNLTQAQKAFFWQNTNTQWKASSNPFL